jgi:hypothetical protein
MILILKDHNKHLFISAPAPSKIQFPGGPSKNWEGQVRQKCLFFLCRGAPSGLSPSVLIVDPRSCSTTHLPDGGGVVGDQGLPWSQANSQRGTIPEKMRSPPGVKVLSGWGPKVPTPLS